MIDFNQKVMNRKLPLISIGANAKTHKSDISDSVYKTAIMYLAPASSVPGFNVCPMAVLAECHKACLFKAGRGAFSNVEKARIMKTLFLRDNQKAFMQLLVKDCARELRKAKRKGYKLAVRLNGTSDLLWELILIDKKTIFELFPEITFYDYAKNVSAKRIRDIAKIPNYSVTASYSEASIKYAKKIAGQDKLNIAVVFRDTIPAFYTLTNGKTLPVLNGDKNDERYLDPIDQQYIVGLKAKGPAKNDTSGFVIDHINVLARAA